MEQRFYKLCTRSRHKIHVLSHEESTNERWGRREGGREIEGGEDNRIMITEANKNGLTG